MTPEDDQEMVLPWASVMVIMVLLKLALTCATPDVMFLRSRRRMRCGSRAIGCLPYLILRSRNAEAMERFRPEDAITSSCRRSAWPCPCGCAHWCACAGRERGDPCDA